MPADLDTHAERLREVVEHVVEGLGIEAEVVVEQTGDELRATVEGEDVAVLIGRHGATIDALQHLAARILFGGSGERLDVVIDAAGYRERREERLHRAADAAADEALRNERAVEMEPMRAAERKIVHRYLQSRSDVTSHSEGDEPQRRLVVSPSSSTPRRP